MVTDNDSLGDKLFTQFPAEQQYPSDEMLQAHILEQYKMYVEMADRISVRRQSANSFFLTVNTALLGFIGYITTKDSSNYLWILGLTGIVLCYLWHRIIRSYRDLNSAKFKVIHAIEKRLPLSPYDAEWEALGRGKDPKLYKPFTHIENFVPYVFMMLHAFNILKTLIKMCRITGL